MDPVSIGLMAAQASSQGMNALLQVGQNRATRKWNEKMYARQRQDALSDWQMQANYNSPAAQMERLKAAGLNPHLVYGNGADAQMGQAVRQSDVQGWNPTPPQFNLGSIIAQAVDVQGKKISNDNLQKQGELLDVEKLLKLAGVSESIARRMKIGTETEIGKVNLEYLQRNLNTALEKSQADLNKVYADTMFTIDQNWRNDQRQQADLKKITEEILTMRKQRAKTDKEIQYIDQQIKNLQSAQTVMDLENQLREIGIQPGDKPLWRLLLGNIIPRNWRRGSDNRSGGVVGGLNYKKF